MLPRRAANAQSVAPSAVAPSNDAPAVNNEATASPWNSWPASRGAMSTTPLLRSPKATGNPPVYTRMSLTIAGSMLLNTPKKSFR